MKRLIAALALVAAPAFADVTYDNFTDAYTVSSKTYQPGKPYTWQFQAIVLNGETVMSLVIRSDQLTPSAIQVKGIRKEFPVAHQKGQTYVFAFPRLMLDDDDLHIRIKTDREPIDLKPHINTRLPFLGEVEALESVWPDFPTDAL